MATVESTAAVMIVDEHESARESIVIQLAADTGVDIVADAADWRTVVASTTTSPPDVVVIDADSSGGDVIAAIGAIRRMWPAARVILLMTRVRDGVLGAVQSMGVDGVVTKYDSLETLRRAIDHALGGGRFYSRRVRARFVTGRNAHSRSGDGKLSPPRITPRELDVIRHIALGRTVKETAKSLALAAPTVDNHKTRLMAKLGVRTGVQLVRYAIGEGIIEP